jgi:hypothetical protein
MSENVSFHDSPVHFSKAVYQHYWASDDNTRDLHAVPSRFNELFDSPVSHSYGSDRLPSISRRVRKNSRDENVLKSTSEAPCQKAQEEASRFCHRESDSPNFLRRIGIVVRECPDVLVDTHPTILGVPAPHSRMALSLSPTCGFPHAIANLHSIEKGGTST